MWPEYSSLVQLSLWATPRPRHQRPDCVHGVRPLYSATSRAISCGTRCLERDEAWSRESVLFIGIPFSILYTSMYSPAGRACGLLGASDAHAHRLPVCELS